MLLAQFPPALVANTSRVVALRTHTRPAHDAIEQLTCMRRLIAADYTLGEYRSLLARLLTYVEPLEISLAVHPNSGFNLECARTPKLRHDLAALGVGEVLFSSAPTALDTLDMTDHSIRAAITYVFEGSALGGQVIRRVLNQHLGAQVADAVSYFDCYDGLHGPVWRRTMQRIEHTPGLDIAKMNATATLIFNSLADWLDPNRQHSARAQSSGASGCPFARLSKWAKRWV